MVLSDLITVDCNLRDAYKLLEPGTMRHVDELVDERRTDPIDAEGRDLRRLPIYTADGQLYSIRGGVPTLSVTRGWDNPLFKRIEVTIERLVQRMPYEHFRPTIDEVEEVFNSDNTIHVDLSQLRLQKMCFDLDPYLIVPTRKNHRLNKEEEKFARRVFGDATFSENMEMFRDSEISNLMIFVFDPAYVQWQAFPFVRASRLFNNFKHCLWFSAIDRTIHGYWRGKERITEKDKI